MLKARLLGFLAMALVALSIAIPSGQAFAATRDARNPHDGTQYFLLGNALNFSNASGTGMDNGATITLNPGDIQNYVNDTFRHTLFVIDSNGNITVYSPGNSPVSAQVSQNSDGSVNILYEISTQSATINFNSTVANGQMTATFQQLLIGGTTAFGQQWIADTNISATFTTTLNWVTADQIPGSPTNGQSQLTSDGGVTLSWSSASGNVVGYDVYRDVLGNDTYSQFLTNTSDTSYTDESSLAIQNAQTVTGIMYTVYAVGPTGVENPNDVVIYISGSLY